MTTMITDKETLMSTQRVVPQTGRGTLRRCLIALVASGFFLAAGGASHAQGAGTYGVRECSNVSPVNPAAPDGVYTTNTAAYQRFDCGSPFGVGAGYGTMAIGCACTAYGSWSFTAPAGTYIRTIKSSMYFDSQQGHTGQIVLGNSAGAVATWNAASFGWQDNVTPQFDTVATYLSETIACGGTCPGATGGVGLANINFTLVDTAAPSIASLAGDLAATGIHRGTETLTVYGTDVGGGLRAASVAVNGFALQDKSLQCDTLNADFAARFRPCPASSAFTFNLPTDGDGWREGSNDLTVCVADFSTGSNQPNTTCTTRIVTVDNSCDDSAGAPAAGSLSADLEPKAGQLTERATVKSTESVPLKGKLVGGGGGVANASVCIYEQVDVPGDPKNLIRIAKTGSNGDFKVNLSAGPSRNLEAVYRYNNHTIEKPLYLSSEAVPTLKVRKRHLRNGQNMRFFGSIPTPHAQQRAVTMQAKVGKQWRTFKQLKTDTDGRFKGRYKFKHSTLARAKYSFRVLVKAQDGYPFAPGKSNKQKVIVRG